jgi:lysophospholipase L1-like esterase
MSWRQSTLALVLVVASCGLATCGGSSTSNAAAPTSPTSPMQPTTGQGCARTTVGLTPLIDLLSGSYQGEPGGLYPGRRNDAPPTHLSAGLALAQAMGPLDRSGQPDSAGRYAFISIGMSNTTQEFGTFVPLANADVTRHGRLSVVDGAQGGMTASSWANPGCNCWSVLATRLQQAGIAPAQVTAAWVKVANAGPTSGFPAYAQTLKAETVLVLQQLRQRYPNLTMAYLSSRIYAGYATTTLNPEPYAYESGLAVRWVIEDQINGVSSVRYSGSAPPAPWVAWGPYLWADGTTANSQGLAWACSDLQSDGTHPSASGQQKVAQRLLDFVRTDPTASEWWR